VTVDFETLEEDAVTVRDRDTKSQDRLRIDAVGPGICTVA
jgi:glycyl-tRNA synthetase (class II)